MLFDLGLIATVLIGGWLALDYAMEEDGGRRSRAIGWLGAFGALWAASDILIEGTEDPDELAIARRLLYLGVYAGTFCWFWVGVQAANPAWYRRSRERIYLLGVPLLALYSTLFLAPDGTLIGLRSPEPQHGPLFPIGAGLCWTLIAAGLCYYTYAAIRLGRVSPLRAASLAGAILVPLVVNILYAFGHVGHVDPTPALLGPTALMLRFGVIDPGLVLDLPLARKDIVEQLAVGVVVADVYGSVIDSNASARKLLGVDDPREHSLDALCAEIDETVEVIRFPLWTDVAMAGTAAVLTDRREAIESERRLQRAGRLEAVGSLTAGMAHEINNPLAFIQSNLNLIEKLIAELVSPEVSRLLPRHLRLLTMDGAESLMDAKDGIDRISVLVSRLKDFARHDARDLADHDPVDLGEAARRAMAVAGIGLAEHAIRVIVRGDPIAWSDEPAIVQILVNLVLNAVQASRAEPDICIEVSTHRDEFEVSVADRGEGLAPEVLERIFDPFFTTKESGSGLGLSICHQLAERLGGRVSAANRKDGGAVFSLFIPRDPETRATAPTTHAV